MLPGISPGTKGGTTTQGHGREPNGLEDLEAHQGIQVFKSKKFTLLRDMAKDLGATEETLREIYAEKNKSAANTRDSSLLVGWSKRFR